MHLTKITAMFSGKEIITLSDNNAQHAYNTFIDLVRNCGYKFKDFETPTKQVFIAGGEGHEFKIELTILI